MMRYLWDAMAYAMSPFWLQPFAVFLSILVVPVFLQCFGWFWGTIALVWIEVGIFDKISQPNVFHGNISGNFYISLGIAVSLFFVYLIYVHSYVSSLSSVTMIGGFVVIGIVWYLCMTTKPEYMVCNDKEAVLSALILASPAEGPADDVKKSPSSNDAGNRWTGNADDIEASKPLIARIDEHDSEPFTLCSYCLIDKCGAHHCNVSCRCRYMTNNVLM